MMESSEEILLEIIMNSGEAKNLAFEAIKEAKLFNFDEANKKLKKASEFQIKAHHAQTELLVEEANENKQKFSMLLVHAQDHLMNCITFVDLAKEVIEIYRRIEK